MRLPFALLALCLVSIFSLPATADDATTEIVLPDIEPNVIVYKETTDANGDPVKLNMYIYQPSGEKSAEPRPAIVFFFGGGWVSGSPSQFFPHCKYFASRGMVTCAAEYRIKSKHGTDPLACVEDGKSAARWLRANATKLGIDPDKIVAGGGSAGGHVAACTGTIKGFNAPGESTDISSVPNAMMLFNPVANTMPEGYGFSRLGDKAKDISPAHNIDKNTPPTIIFHGEADTTVPLDNVVSFKKRMDELGLKCQLDVFEGQKHGFFNYRKNGGKFFAPTVLSGDKFLIECGILSAK